ncbi:hypothetical protein PMEGAS67_01560 [Priestia megaterium]
MKAPYVEFFFAYAPPIYGNIYHILSYYITFKIPSFSNRLRLFKIRLDLYFTNNNQNKGFKRDL